MCKLSVGERTGLYLHIPFCAQKCPYCDFNTYAGLENYFQQMVDALCGEMERWHTALADRVFTTVFIGGGTPTVLDEAQLTQLFTTLRRCFQLSAQCEITCEANPGTVDQSKFDILRALGTNRLSIGVQSFQADELRFLGRIHNTEDVTAAFIAARNANFDNINLDFIFGLPGQKVSAWQATLDAALQLQPEHLSLYSLIVEPNTPLHHWVATGQVADTNDDHAAELYEAAIVRLQDAGYFHYEVSNWARYDKSATATVQSSTVQSNSIQTSNITPNNAQPSDAHLCEHNLIYWRNQNYLGIGPGAHSHLHLSTPLSSQQKTLLPILQAKESSQQYEYRWGNRKPVPSYIKRIERGDSVEEFHEVINPRLAMGETMMLGLRLLHEGVERKNFYQRFGIELDDIFAKEIAELQKWNLITIDQERVRLSERGIFLGNQVFSYFLPEEETM